MVVTQHRSVRKVTSGRYISSRKKRLYELGRAPTHTKVGKTKRTIISTKGGGKKVRILSTEYVNILDPKTQKYTKSKIVTVSKTPANMHFARRNIITKGTILETEKGKVRVTSRPGQDGIVNAVLI
ncbi:30S ribosomal protein S8e [Candidatus Woesearchaeota archaeon]|nr:30S ribosomal protein S8e [Candidatus Woesearchaeota archaeon]